MMRKRTLLMGAVFSAVGLLWLQPGGYGQDLPEKAFDSKGGLNRAAVADLIRSDPKMHFPQLPDEAGWDAKASGNMIVADDWQCSESGYITDIRFWGSWSRGEEGQILSFKLSIHENLPSNPPEIPFTRPGAVLWFETITNFTDSAIVPTTSAGWFDRSNGMELYRFGDHQEYFQYDISLPIYDWFWQDSGTVYWLAVQATVADPDSTEWGWRSSDDTWAYASVWMPGGTPWLRVKEPVYGYPFIAGDVDASAEVDSADLSFIAYWIQDGIPEPPYIINGFHAAADANGDCNDQDWADYTVLFEYIFGVGSAPGSCASYPAAQFGGNLHMAFVLYGGGGQVGACCYSDGPGGNRLCADVTEYDCVIGYQGEFAGAGTACLGTQACCLPNNQCVEADAYCCTEELGGTPQGPFSICSSPQACCLPDNRCLLIDPECCQNLGGTPQGQGTTCSGVQACCLPDQSCIMVDGTCCESLGGTPQGAGSQCTLPQACCLSDGSCIEIAAVCCISLGGTPQGEGKHCTTPQCCCLYDGSGDCIEVDPLCCDEMGGIPAPGGELACQGDLNGNNVDDACEGWEPGDSAKMHYPQLPDESGWDVSSTYPLVLADDWQCSETGWIGSIHFWGSWKGGIVGQITGFDLSIRADIPADPPSVPYSRPGAILWQAQASAFLTVPVDPAPDEGWYDPNTGEVLTNDHQAYAKYNIYLPQEEWFEQTQGTIYWLTISATVADTINTRWGWKSSADHWNDDAVWGESPTLDWLDLYEPPTFVQSLDLAFVVAPGNLDCDCTPGDADGNGTLNVSDAVYLITYIFGGGPEPTPYYLCSGDVDCNCITNVSDVVYMLSWIFAGGPAPCSCQDWVSSCGIPIRKK